MLISTTSRGGGQNLERQNVQRSVFRNLKIANIKITKDELCDSFINEFFFPFFLNYLNSGYLIIFQNVKYCFSKLLNF